MRWKRIFVHRLQSLLRRSRSEANLQREIDLHLEQLAREHMANGMSEPEARLAAQRDFGPIDLTKEHCRDMRRINAIENTFRDLAYAFRLLRKSPGLTATAVLSLAIGIGANTAIFSLVNAVLLRTLPVREPQQLVEIARPSGGTLSYPFFEAIRDHNQVFSGVLLLSAGRLAASSHLGGADLGEVHLSPVSGNYFTVLGVSPAIGRMLTEQDLNTSNVVVISYGFWQRALAANPAVLGKTLRVGADHRSYTIVGVGPKHFSGLATGQPIDLWIPVTPSQNRVAMMFHVIARRKPDIPEGAIEANVQFLTRQLSREWKFEQPLPIEVTSASSGLTQLRQRFTRPLLALLFVSTLLLLMVALNLTNLLLARAAVRQREIGVRLSLDASRSRVLRQLLTESFVLGSTGSLLGVLLAPAAAGFLVRFLSLSAGTMELPFSIDEKMLAFTIAVSLIVIFLFGTAPAWAAVRIDLPSLFLGSFRTISSLNPTWRGKSLMVAQVGISCVLLAGAALFSRSLQALAQVDTGFHSENVLLLNVGVREGGPTGMGRVRLYHRVLQRLAVMPGVRSTALSSESLFSGGTWTEEVNTPDFMPQRGVDRESILLAVSPGFFQTLGISLLQDRDFTSHDDENAPRAAIVNEAMARYYFGAVDPIGRTFDLESSSFPKPLTVVGLVRNAKYHSLKEAFARIIYLPALQTAGPLEEANIAVRTTGDPVKMVDSLWKAVQSESLHLRFGGFTTQERLVKGTIAQDRMLAQLSGFFGLSAAALVCLGLYGLTAYQVSRRTAEIGIRVALGAQQGNVLWMILRDLMSLIIFGTALGLGATLFLARSVKILLFGVSAFDTVALLIAPAILVSIGTVATYWPARRAAALDPANALRYE